MYSNEDQPFYSPPAMQRQTIILPAFQPTKEQLAALAAQIGTEESSAMPGFTNDQVSNMKAYAAKLRSKYPQMKAERLARKVKEYFKLKDA